MGFIIACVFIGLFIWLLPTLLTFLFFIVAGVFGLLAVLLGSLCGKRKH